MNYKSRFLFFSTFLLITTLLSFPAIGNEKALFSGKVQIKDKAVSFKHIYAWFEPDSFHKEQWKLILLFSESVLENPQNQTGNPSPIALKLSLSLNSPDSVGGGAQIFLEGEMEATTSTSDKFVLTSCSSNRIEGKAYHDGESESWDFTFAVPLLWKTGTEPFKTCYLGKPLSADGGEPGKAFRKYRETLRLGNLELAKKTATENFGKFLNSQYMTESISELKTRIPSGFDIVTGFCDEKTATLFVRKSGSQNIEDNGVVKLVMTGTEWKVSADLFTDYVHDDLLAKVMSMPDKEEDFDTLSPEELNERMQTAVLLDEADTIRTLAKKGVDINPFLLKAVTFQREISVKTILELGADVNFIDEDGTSPLIALFSLDAKEGARKILDRLLAAGAKVNYKPGDGDTALMEAVNSAAAYKNQEARECIQPLLEAGADPNMKGNSGDNAIRMAVREGDLEVMSLLLKNANRKVSDEDNPIRYAVADIYDEETLLPVVDTLLKSGWSPNIRVGSEPLLIDAVLDSKTGLVKMLAQAGADLEVRDQRGETALILAVDRFNVEMVKVLIEAGANVNVKTWTDRSLISFAKDYAGEEIVALLQGAGATE
jgi:ankyrin repeat protein